MDLAARKWNIMERLSLIMDDEAITRIERYVESQMQEEDLTLAELDQLDEQEAKRQRGEVKMYSQEDAIRIMREGSHE